MPDGTGCSHRWQELSAAGAGEGGGTFVNAPLITVSRCPAAEPCCGFDCGPHGNTAGAGAAGAGGCSCVCSDGYVGAACDLAPAYLIQGAVHPQLNGRYTRLPLPGGSGAPSASGGGGGQECNGLPVYQQDGSDGMVLFQPTGADNWMVGSSSAALSCEKSGFLQTPVDTGGCKDSPGEIGCVSQWLEASDTSWDHAPLVTLLVCKAEFPCCGMECGDHGTVTAPTTGEGSAAATATAGDGNGNGSVGVCSCSCAPGYIGTACELAAAYTLAGATSSLYNGRYEPTTLAGDVSLPLTCNGKPVYQKGGYLLLQPTGLSVWVVSPRSTVPGQPETDCGAAGVIMSANSAGCAVSPDAEECAGKWQQPTSSCAAGKTWCDVPALAVVSASGGR